MKRLLLLALSALALVPSPATAQRVVAITLDDLPYAGHSLDDARLATNALLAALAAHEAKADVFVEGKRVEVAGEGKARRDLLRRWRDAGHALHNHGYRHLRYSQTRTAEYLDDVARGRAVVAGLLAETPSQGQVGFFRAPYNDLGETAATREVLTASLGARGVRLAPFTIEHGDWMFNAVYEDALARGDRVLADRIARAYLAHLDAAFSFAERLSAETFGHEIPQVLLIHANRINADHLDDMLERLHDRGYRFVSLRQAIADPAYATEDAYTARWGVSWLHRWRAGLGLQNALREEPEPPAWLSEAFQALQK